MEVEQNEERPIRGFYLDRQRTMYPLIPLMEHYFPVTKTDRQARSFMLYALMNQAAQLSVWDIEIVPGQRDPFELHRLRIPVRVVARIHGPEKERLWRKGLYNPNYFLKQMNKRLGLQMEWDLGERREYCEIYNFRIDNSLRDFVDNLVFGVSLSKGYSYIIG